MTALKVTRRSLLVAGLLTIITLPLRAEDNNGQTEVVVTTNYGAITLRLFADKAPLTVANFLRYVDERFYDQTIFHRVKPDFMIQGGGFTVDMAEKTTHEPVANESRNRIHNTRGTIAMARTNDPDSATSQFFINQRTNLYLDWAPGREGYTVFGDVIDGMNVVDFIATSPVKQVGNHMAVPVEPVIIQSIRRKQ